MIVVASVADQLLTVSDAALMLECPVAQVRRLRADGELSAFYVGTEPMFRWGDVRSLQRQPAVVAQSKILPRNRVFGSGRQQHRVVASPASETAILTEGCGEAW